LLVGLTLALVTAIAFLRLAELLAAEPLRSRIAPSSGNSALVRGFYDAVNATIATGRHSDLDRLLAADFVEHGGPPGLLPTRAGLAQRLVTLHAIYPTLRLAEQGLIGQGEVVVAHVRVEDATRGTFLGLSLPDQSMQWGTVDVFRIADGRIAEHWGGQETLFLEPFYQELLDFPVSPLQTISLVRTTIAPGGTIAVWAIRGPEAILLESGRLTVAIDSGSTVSTSIWRALPAGSTAPPEEVVPSAEVALAAGDLVLFPEGLRATVRNDGAVAVTILTVALRRPGGGARAAGVPPEMATDDLDGGALVALPGGPATLGLGRVTLTPGTALPVAATGVAQFVVETGSLNLANASGTVWSRRAEDNSLTTGTDSILGPGDAVTLSPGTTSDLRNVGATPLVLLVVTIAPVG
jgi:mannose-6-phosphate isomerase-like protein (cupin superfamily)/predicted ester cyclase